jgi:hypothetical protein
MMKIVLLMKKYTGLHIDMVNLVTMSGIFLIVNTITMTDNNNNIKIYFKYFRKAVPLTPDPFTRSCSTP